jgi:hypothetical protein
MVSTASYYRWRVMTHRTGHIMIRPDAFVCEIENDRAFVATSVSSKGNNIALERVKLRDLLCSAASSIYTGI